METMKDICEIDIKLWVERGKMIYSTCALDWEDPDHPYNQVLAMGKVPEDYGIEHPLIGGRSKKQLIDEIIRLRKLVREDNIFDRMEFR